MVDGEEEFELQTILQHTPGSHRGDSRIKYLVIWKGFGPAYNSWEPEKTLQQHAGEALDEYWDEVAAVQAAQDIDTGLTPSAISELPATAGRGRGRTGRGRGRGRGRTGQQEAESIVSVKFAAEHQGSWKPFSVHTPLLHTEV